MTTEPTSAANRAANGTAFRDELKHDAERLKGTIGKRAKTEATTRIDEASDAMGSASEALEAAAEKLENKSDAPKWMASAIQQAARKMDNLAVQLKGSDLHDIGQDITQFARHNPGTFISVSAAAGFAAARVLRSGVDKKRHDQPGNASTNQWSTGDGQSADAGDDKAWAADQAGTAQHDAEGVMS